MAESIKNNGQRIGDRRRWVASVALGGMAVALACALFRQPAPPPPLAGEARLVIGLSGEERDAVSSEEAEFLDPTPRFMPTRWNSSEKALRRPESYGSFTGYDPHYAFDATHLTLGLPPPISVPAGAPQALEINPPGNPSLGIGRADLPSPALAPRQARIDIVAEGSGRQVWQEDLPPGTVPELIGREWQYLDLMAVVDAAGLVGPLALTPRSNEGSGNYFPPLGGKALIGLENYIANHVLLGRRLTPGFYRISVGP